MFCYHCSMARNRKRRRQSADSSEGYIPQTRTYQTRIAVYEGIDRSVGDAALSAYAALYGKVQRKLFADVAAGRSAVSKKSEYIEEHGIPARMFNAVRVSLEGKVSAVRESQLLQLDSLRRRVSREGKQVDKAEKECQWWQVHGKRRRLANLKFRLSGLEADLAAGRVRLCFGSKKLWRKQHHLEQNGYASHEEWQQDWRDVRSNEFFVLGSRDETAGCQLCVAAVNDDGTLTLRLRMPDSLAGRHGKYLVVPNVRFACLDTMWCWRRWGATRSTRCTDGSMVRRRRELPRSARLSATASSVMRKVGGYSPPRNCRRWRSRQTGGVERSGWT